MTQLIHNFKVGQIARLALEDDALESGQWFESRVRAISRDRIWMDLDGITIFLEDESSAIMGRDCHIYFSYGRAGDLHVGFAGNSHGGDLLNQCWQDLKASIELVDKF